MSATTTPNNNWKHPKRIAEYSAEYIPDEEDKENNPSTKRYKVVGHRGGEESQSPIVIRKKRLFDLSREKNGGMVLSPITEISLNLSDASLGTPLRGRRRDISRGRNESDLNNNGEDTAKSFGEDQPPEDQVHGPAKCGNSKIGRHGGTPKGSVVSNNFDLNAFSRQRTTGGLSGRRLVMDSSMHTTNMDELSFYDDDSHHANHAFTSSPTMNTLLMDEDRLLSPEGSPQRFQIVQQPQSFRKLLEPSPRTKKSSSTSVMRSNKKPFQMFHSLSSGSMESTMDDEYMELFEMESLDDGVPSNLNSLISGHIKTTKTSPELMKRPPVRRCLSLTENNCSATKARTSLFEPKTPEILRTVQDRIPSSNQSPIINTTPYTSRLAAERCFKRPEPPSTTVSPIQSKRYKGEIYSSAEKENNALLQLSAQPQRPALRKHVSMNDADIMTALSRSSSEPDLIGDFSKPYCLPLIDGRHRDLKSISHDTMSQLITGAFDHTVASYKIIDCRYPYEFEGGHIRGAMNLYTQEQIMEEFVNCKTDNTATVEAEGPKRNIIVFHCEFSSERGPKLSRFLRNHDRASNTNAYPALHYPEIYLLHNGYKEFYESHAELCDPHTYRPMLEPSYAEAYKHFRAKSKSWNGDVKNIGGNTNRLKKSRSRLVL